MNDMINPDKRECSECGSYDTSRVHVEWLTDEVHEVRICHSCPTEYTNRFSLYEQRTEQSAHD